MGSQEHPKEKVESISLHGKESAPSNNRYDHQEGLLENISHSTITIHHDGTVDILTKDIEQPKISTNSVTKTISSSLLLLRNLKHCTLTM